MKKIIYILAVSALVLSSCNLDREPLNGPSSGTFPASEEEALAGVLAAYKALSNVDVKDTPFPTRYMDMSSDIGIWRFSGNTPNQLEVMQSNIAVNNSLATKIYQHVYKVAQRVHLVLDNLDRLEGRVPEETIAQFRAELLLIRDYYYDLGCQFYGDIPFIDHCLSLTDYMYDRTPRADVIDRILTKDLSDETLDALPLQWPVMYGTVRLGRVGAYAIKARIALNWANLLNRPDYYDIAASCAAKALELGEGLYGLQPLNTTYYATAADGEPDPTPLFGFAGETSKEWLWAAQYNKLISSNYTPAAYYQYGRMYGGCSWYGPNQHFIDTFQCTDGKSIAESPLYDWQDPWKNRDPRLDLYCIRNDSRVFGVEFSTDVRKTKVYDYNKGVEVNNGEAYGTKSEYGANGTKGVGGYLWRKWADVAQVEFVSGSGSTFDDLNVGIIRWAELLLIDAEANIEKSSPDLARAGREIDEVRARVNMPPVADRSQAGLRSALRYERKVELCSEGHRWFDIRRWKIAPKVNTGWIYAPPFSAASPSILTDPKAFYPNAIPQIDEDWNVTYDPSKTFDGSTFNLRKTIEMKWDDERGWLWPIPYDEVMANEAITYQNPGYAVISREGNDSSTTTGN